MFRDSLCLLRFQLMLRLLNLFSARVTNHSCREPYEYDGCARILSFTRPSCTNSRIQDTTTISTEYFLFIQQIRVNNSQTYMTKKNNSTASLFDSLVIAGV
jgi:hypothetical protein